jgi:hypothetical protein
MILATSTDFSNKVKITGWTNGLTQNTTLDGANGNITVPTTGTYEVHISLSCSGTANNTYSFALFANTITQRGVRTTRRFSNADVGVLAFGVFVSLTAGDVLSLYVQNETAINNLLVEDGSFNLQKIA